MPANANAISSCACAMASPYCVPASAASRRARRAFAASRSSSSNGRKNSSVSALSATVAKSGGPGAERRCEPTRARPSPGGWASEWRNHGLLAGDAGRLPRTGVTLVLPIHLPGIGCERARAECSVGREVRDWQHADAVDGRRHANQRGLGDDHPSCRTGRDAARKYGRRGERTRGSKRCIPSTEPRRPAPHPHAPSGQGAMRG